MSNVVKLASARGAKKDPAVKWKEYLEKQGDKLMDRLFDQIMLTEVEAAENNVPEELSGCSILAVLSRLMVFFSSTRDVLGPSALIMFVEYQIELEKKALREELEEEWEEE
jgi:hypothetical protein